MKLPHMKYGDKITKQTQIAFGGYNHSPNAKDGEIYDMQNVSSDLYPLITQRKKREDVGNVSGYLFKGKEFWMGNFGGQGEIFISNKPDIEEKLKFGNVIKLDITGEFESNSGRYIVMGITYSSDGYIRITTNETFSAVGVEGERPPDNSAKIPVNNGELCIKYFQKVKSSESETNTEVTYESAEVTSDISKYTLEDERMIAERKKVSSELGYSKDKNVVVYNVSYSDTPTVSDSGTVQYSDGYLFAGVSKIYNMNNLKYYKITAVDVSGNEYWGYINSVTYGNYGYVTMTFYNHNFTANSYSQISLNTIKLYAPILSVVSSVDDDIFWSDTNDGEHSSTVYNGDTLTETTVNWTTVYKVTTTITNTVSELERYYLNVLSIGAGEHIYFVTDNGDFYYDGMYRGTLTAGDKQFAQTGAYLYILPDNVYYNISSNEIVRSESAYIKAYDGLSGFDGNCIDADENLAIFKAGDVVDVYVRGNKLNHTFSGVSIKAVTVNRYSNFTNTTIEFSTNLLTRDGLTLEDFGAENMWDFYGFTITKGTPGLKYICADSNRVWGCTDKTIYCTSFGNPLGWYEYDVSQAGNDADIAWTIEPFDSEGDFTGCCIYNDRPMFFKENKIYKVYGSKASDFQLSSEETPGVSDGSSESICIIDSVLYYLSPEGVMRYTGNYGTCISDEFYESFENAVGGSDGTHYYITMQCGDEWKTFTYNTKKRLWCIEDNKRVKRYFDFERNVFRHNFDGQIQCINPSSAEYPELFENITRENDFESFIEFGDFYVDVLNKKAPSKLNFRFLVEDGNVEILINYDSEEADGQRVWNSVKTIQSDKKKSIIMPMIPKRCDHYRIKIKGSGKWTLYAMSYEYYVGTEL